MGVFGGNNINWQNRDMIRDGLILNYDFAIDGCYTTSGVNNLSIENHNADISGSPVLSHEFGGGLSLNGSSDYLTIPYDSDLNFPNSNNDFTIEVVIDTNSQNNDRKIFQQGDGNGRSWIYRDDSISNLNSFLGGSPLVLTNNPSLDIFSGDLFSCVLKYDNGVLFLGKNGVFYESGSKSIDENSTGDFYIGSHKTETHSRWHGNVYLFRIYDRALSSEEVGSNFEVIRNRFNI